MELILALFGIACVGLGYCLGRVHATVLFVADIDRVIGKLWEGK